MSVVSFFFDYCPSFSPSKRLLTMHIYYRHKVNNPVLNTNYYKHFAAKDLANVPDCVPYLA